MLSRLETTVGKKCISNIGAKTYLQIYQKKESGRIKKSKQICQSKSPTQDKALNVV